MDDRGWEVIRDEDGAWRLNWKHGTMQICPASCVARSVAIDAACEFMERFESGRMPPECENPGDLMRFCARSSEKEVAA